MTFTERIARSLDHPIDIACGARPRWTVRISAVFAGLGAAVGSVVGGTSILAGLGGGLGVIVGYVVVWLVRVRGTGLGLGMALALTRDRLELLKVNGLGNRATGVIRSLPYSEIRSVDVRERIIEIGIDVDAGGAPIAVDTSKFGVGSGREFVDELRRRIGA
jgi:hypothetical protein